MSRKAKETQDDAQTATATLEAPAPDEQAPAYGQAAEANGQATATLEAPAPADQSVPAESPPTELPAPATNPEPPANVPMPSANGHAKPPGTAKKKKARGIPDRIKAQWKKWVASHRATETAKKELAAAKQNELLEADRYHEMMREEIDDDATPRTLYHQAEPEDDEDDDDAPAATPDEPAVVDESWRDILLSDAMPEIDKGIIKKLHEADLRTVGELWKFQDAGCRLDEDIKGIGKVKAEKIEDAMLPFWARHGLEQQRREAAKAVEKPAPAATEEPTNAVKETTEAGPAQAETPQG